MTAYNGQAITYDAMGNPITYNGYTYTWDMGRRLKSISNGANTYSYTYDENGLRTSKTVNGETTNFIYQDSLLKAQYTEDYSMLFWYDENCSPIGFVYTDKTAETPTNETFIYKKNVLGDILGFYNSQGELVAQYWYDEWGVWFNAVWDSSQDVYTFLLNNNPLLYRGYYYDLETRYYYLQSRYYNPEWGRFLNADDVNYIGATGTGASVSAYAYCENNSIAYIDVAGFVAFQKVTYEYDRDKAIRYAKKWYNSYNKDYYKYGQDCANFVSQCLYAGGMTVFTEEWHSLKHKKFCKDIKSIFLGIFNYKYRYDWDVGEAWRLADKQYKYFKKSVYANKTFKIKKKSDVSSLIKKYNIKKGDLMHFDYNNDGVMNHATIISKVKNGRIYYSAHTSSEFNKPLTDFFKKHNEGVAYIITLHS